MNQLSNKVKVFGLVLVWNAWPQLLTMAGFMMVILIRFPLWFVVLSAVVSVTALTYLCRRLAAQTPISYQDHAPLLGAILVCSGLASIGLTLKWGSVESQLKMAPGTLLYLTDHAQVTVSSTLAWSSVITQWGSCSIFLVAVAIWASSSWRTV